MKNPRPSPLATASSHPRLAEQDRQVRIPKTVICDTCGYNLKGSPFVATCSECGSPYNARRALGSNIYRPGTLQFPWHSLLLVGFFLPVAMVFGWSWYGFGWLVFLPFTVTVPVVTLVAVIGSLYAVWRFSPELRRYLRSRRWELLHAESIAEDYVPPGTQAPAPPARSSEDTTTPTRELVFPDKTRLEQLAEQGYETTLDWPAICATCGYRLQGLPYMGTCPECGAEYNARPNKMLGMISPYGTSRPWGDIWASTACVVLSTLLVRFLFSAFNVGILVFAVLFAAGAIAFASVAWRKGRAHKFARDVLKLLEAEEDDEA